MKFINIKDDSPKENKDYFVKVHPGTDDEYLDVFYWGGEYFSKRGIYFDLPMAFLDEQDEGWVPVETPPPTNEKYNESDYCLCLHESGEQVVCWYNSKDKAWRVGNYKADSLPLTGITHYRKLPAPPATKD